jgi:hypothetical protein
MKKMFVFIAAAVCGVSLLADESTRIVISQEADYAVAMLVNECKQKFGNDTLKVMRSALCDGKMLLKYRLTLQKRGMKADQMQNDQKLLALSQKFSVGINELDGKMLEDLHLNPDSDAVLDEIAFLNDGMNEVLSKFDFEAMNDLQRGDLMLLLVDCALKHLDN